MKTSTNQRQRLTEWMYEQLNKWWWRHFPKNKYFSNKKRSNDIKRSMDLSLTKEKKRNDETRKDKEGHIKTQSQVLWIKEFQWIAAENDMRNQFFVFIFDVHEKIQRKLNKHSALFEMTYSTYITSYWHQNGKLIKFN